MVRFDFFEQCWVHLGVRSELSVTSFLGFCGLRSGPVTFTLPTLSSSSALVVGILNFAEILDFKELVGIQTLGWEEYRFQIKPDKYWADKLNKVQYAHISLCVRVRPQTNFKF